MNWQDWLPYSAYGLLALSVVMHALMKLPGQLRSLLSWALAWVLTPTAAVYAQQYTGNVVVLDSSVSTIIHAVCFVAIFMTLRIGLGLALIFLGFAGGRNALSMTTGVASGVVVGIIQLSVILTAMSYSEAARSIIASQVGSEFLLGVVQSWTDNLNQLLVSLNLIQR